MCFEHSHHEVLTKKRGKGRRGIRDIVGVAYCCSDCKKDFIKSRKSWIGLCLGIFFCAFMSIICFGFITVTIFTVSEIGSTDSDSDVLCPVTITSKSLEPFYVENECQYCSFIFRNCDECYTISGPSDGSPYYNTPISPKNSTSEPTEFLACKSCKSPK